MSNYLNASEIREQVSLVGLLTRLGYYPVRASGKEQLYISMLRDSDTNPSLAVNDDLGVWYDHGLGKGGNVIDFSLAYWPNLPFKEVLEKIVAVSNLPLTSQKPDAEPNTRRRHALKVPHYQIEDIKELGNNPAITAYLQQRGVWEAAEGRLKEIYYYVEDEKKQRKQFFAAGWQNEVQGWEVRNKYFKGCLGHKGLTLIPGENDRLAVFEGYINYLSWLTLNPEADSNVLVLNSLALLQAGIKKASDFNEIDLYLDRDKSGEQASLEFIKALPTAIDRSATYQGYGDYNDYLRASIKANQDFAYQQPTEVLFKSAFSR
ncbi:Toprim domain-containing protein [Mucilaginibacter gracilis]|uniref:Toprim domain-containing protein n=1 Tax=Mucilaginibacter gracilis TaxID=423350 RepID=A0A495IX31_9SPHI|nr:toprim domain-containing protein [Mucilaginibacter gracilis]RKR80598.1 Toprim domain-containing protein [Mucilaginibacter gracilis]